MWLVHILDKQDDTVIIVFVRQAANEQEASDKAASNYNFPRGYDAMARKLDSSKNLQEVFHSWRD